MVRSDPARHVDRAVKPEQIRVPKRLEVLGGNRRRLVGLLGSWEQHVVRDRAGPFRGLGE
jgi:hypothetical protein